ncbi:MAG: DEAD/DEAH box helicase [Candidatus Altimarinota bacterium]
MFQEQTKRRRRGKPRPFRRQSRRPGPKKINVSQFISKATGIKNEEYVPVHTFADFQIEEKLKHNILQKGYIQPSPIQDKAIPEILSGKDVVGLANTGTGKTAAFLIPLINKVMRNPRESVLIMAPTRELAFQIQKEFVTFAKNLHLHSTLCIGGASMGVQISQLRRGPHFVIGTPGRLKDLIQQGVLNLSKCGNVVLDEADQMMDMGFIHDMRFILEKLPEQKQSLFFSATMPPEIQSLVASFLKDPVTISVKLQDTSANVDQDVIPVASNDEKFEILCNLLSQPDFDKVLVFGRTKYGVEKLAKALLKRGFKAESIHGNKTQNKRQKAVDLFKAHHVQVLVATDVMSRGMDIPNVSHVINYDLPQSYEDYVHRIGRTGRAAQTGVALTFVEG